MNCFTIGISFGELQHAMSQPSSQRTRQRSQDNRDRPLRNQIDFVDKYLKSSTGQRLLSKTAPKMALAFQQALGR